MLEHTSVRTFGCARMPITFSPIWMFTALCVCCIFCVCVCVWRLLAATCESGVPRLASLLQRPPRVDALERERTRECSADESEATPRGPLGIYYNQ